jgi:hypothetical protein
MQAQAVAHIQRTVSDRSKSTIDAVATLEAIEVARRKAARATWASARWASDREGVPSGL